MRPADCWEETPYCLQVYVEETTKQRIITAWHQSGMNQWAKTKKFPKTPDALTGDNKNKKQSPLQMLAIAKAWAKEVNPQAPPKKNPVKGRMKAKAAPPVTNPPKK